MQQSLKHNFNKTKLEIKKPSEIKAEQPLETKILEQKQEEIYAKEKELLCLLDKITNHDSKLKGIDDLLTALNEKYEALTSETSKLEKETKNNYEMIINDLNGFKNQKQLDFFNQKQAEIQKQTENQKQVEKAKKNKFIQIENPLLIKETINKIRQNFPLFPEDFSKKLYTTDVNFI
jgi:hypothetical protein